MVRSADISHALGSSSCVVAKFLYTVFGLFDWFNSKLATRKFGVRVLSEFIVKSEQASRQEYGSLPYTYLVKSLCIKGVDPETIIVVHGQDIEKNKTREAESHWGSLSSQRRPSNIGRWHHGTDHTSVMQDVRNRTISSTELMESGKRDVRPITKWRPQYSSHIGNSFSWFGRAGI